MKCNPKELWFQGQIYMHVCFVLYLWVILSVDFLMLLAAVIHWWKHTVHICIVSRFVSNNGFPLLCSAAIPLKLSVWLFPASKFLLKPKQTLLVRSCCSVYHEEHMCLCVGGRELCFTSLPTKHDHSTFDTNRHSNIYMDGAKFSAYKLSMHSLFPTINVAFQLWIWSLCMLDLANILVRFALRLTLVYNGF